MGIKSFLSREHQSIFVVFLLSIQSVIPSVALAKAKKRPDLSDRKSWSQKRNSSLAKKELWPEDRDLLPVNDGFWGKVSAKDFAWEKTQEVVSLYPKYEKNECVAGLTGNPEDFVEVFVENFKEVTDAHNRVTLQLKGEIDRLNKSSYRGIFVPQYLTWLKEMSESFFNLKNFETLIPALSVPAMESEFWPPSGDFNRKSLGGNAGDFEFFFNFMNLFRTEEMEQERLKAGVFFLPVSVNLRKQLEYLSNTDFSKTSFDRESLIDSICERIDEYIIRNYAVKYGFSPPSWLQPKTLASAGH